MTVRSMQCLSLLRITQPNFPLPCGVSQALIEMLVQIFYAWRIKVLSSSMWATLLVLLFAILQCCMLFPSHRVCHLMADFCPIWCHAIGIVAGIATAVAVAFVPDFLHFRVFKPAVIVWLSCTAICDCLITLILVLYLVGPSSLLPYSRGALLTFLLRENTRLVHKLPMDLSTRSFCVSLIFAYARTFVGC